MQVSSLSITSFGFDKGEASADLVLDARTISHDLVSGYWESDGNNPELAQRINESESAIELTAQFRSALESGCSSVAVGCSQGRHRSVALANRFVEIAKESNIAVTLEHRDLGKLRSKSMTIETRSFEARADLEERTIVGLAVPYGQLADIGGAYQERFVAGAIDSVEDVKLFYGHEEPIGKVVEGRDTEAGYEILARVSDTPRGNEVLTLMRDGVLNKFSVGFLPVESERDGTTITRTKVSLKEVSVVPFPAFTGANITEVREEQLAPEAELTIEQERDSMSENIELEVRSVMDEVAELRRVVEAGQTSVAPAVIGSEIRSQAEFAKKLLKGDSEAVELARAASDSCLLYTSDAADE